MAIQPLEGIRVVDFGWVYAGPVLGHLLADMGAEVFRVETRKRIDSLRLTPENSSRDPEKDHQFHDVNRNKLGITLDIDTPDGVKLTKELIGVSDMLVENFGPKVLPGRGLGYEDLRKVNPALIMVSLPAAGRWGPLSHIRTYGPTLASLTGLDSLMGYPGERVLGRSAVDLDPNSAVHAFFAALAALHYRAKTGRGQYIEVPQWETSVASLASEAILQYAFTGSVMDTHGNREPHMAPHNLYPCQGDDEWIAIAVATEEEWRGLCQAMGGPAWARDSRFADMASRLDHQEELDQLLGQWTSQQDKTDLMHHLQRHGVAATSALHIGERLFDPHFEARGLYLQQQHPVTGQDWLVGSPWKLSETPFRIERPSPMMGQHNDYVFGQLLGLPAQELQRLDPEQTTQ